MTDFILVRYARKPESLHEIESVLRYREGSVYKTEIIETKEMTAAEYDSFVRRPLASRDWLAGKGGFRSKDIRLAIAVTAPERRTLYVDPSGSDYGRYIGMCVDDAVKYPDIKIQLTGKDGNVFNILGLCTQAARRADLPQTEIDAFFNEATSGDYNKALATCQRWFDCR